MAFEPLQREWSSARTLHRDARWLVVDKPAGVSCRTSREAGAPGLDLCERLQRHGLPATELWLEPPERASGATLLGFEPAPRAEAAPAPIERLSQLLGVDAWRLPEHGQLPSVRSGAAPPLDYRVVRRRGERALVRVVSREPPDAVAQSFARAGQPVVGDAGGSLATRLLLHVERIEGAGLDVTAPLPAEFESWLEGAPQRPPSQFSRALSEAATVRAGLWPEHDAYRLLGEDAGEISGVTADRYAEHAVLELSTAEAWQERQRLAECLMDHGAKGVYVKRRVRADLRKQSRHELAPALPLCGVAAPDPVAVRCGFARFWVRLGDGLATGLYLDQRASWQRLSRCAGGAALLNLFSYTGAFTVAAAAGAAAASVSVDLSRSALSRLSLNLELNGLSGPAHRLHADDVLRWLTRAARAGRRFDWIVLDPPSFGTRRSGVLRAERDYPGLVAAALGLLRPGGRLLCVSHQLGVSQRELGQLVTRALAEIDRAGAVQGWVGGWDAPTLPGVSGTKSVLAQLR